MNQTVLNLYSFQSKLVRLGWLLLFFLPYWQWSKTIVWTIVIIVSFAYIYLLVFGKRYDSQQDYVARFKDYYSLKGIMAMFTNARVTAIAWFHFLAFDLLIGLHIVIDAQQLMIPHWLLLPFLVASLMIGPAGLIAYLGLRMVYMQEIAIF